MSKLEKIARKTEDVNRKGQEYIDKSEEQLEQGTEQREKIDEINVLDENTEKIKEKAESDSKEIAEQKAKEEVEEPMTEVDANFESIREEAKNYEEIEKDNEKIADAMGAEYDSAKATAENSFNELSSQYADSADLAERIKAEADERIKKNIESINSLF